MNYIGIANNEKLVKLFNEMREGLLILRPAFQRKLVWNFKHKENFIETILKKYPFPEIYLSEGDVDLETQKSTRLVVDGQQRLNTIYEYIMGTTFRCTKISSFSELSGTEKKDFFNYQVVVRDLGEIDEPQIREIFKRINSVQYALNAMEIRNALYEGEFISTAKSVAEGEELQKLNIFTETQFSRMKNAEFVLLIMSTIEIGGYFAQDKEVETLIKNFDNLYSGKSKMKNDIKDVLSLIINCKLPADSIWFRLSSFFTLVVELVKYKRKNGKLPSTATVEKTLLELEEEIYRNKLEKIDKNQYARYYHYTFQATTGKVGRIARGEVLKKHLDMI